MEAPVDKTKLTVNLNDEAMSALRELADKRGVTLGQALGQAIASEKFFSDETSKGGKVLIEKPDRTVREVVIR
jgi:cysteine synthase